MASSKPAPPPTPSAPPIEFTSDGRSESKDDALLKSLDPTYFTDKCNPIGIMWKSLPRFYTEEFLTSEIKKYSSALHIVEMRLSAKVMSSYNQFVKAVNDVQSLGTDLLTSMTICKQSKESLVASKEYLVSNGMKIVSLYKRREKVHAATVLMVKLKRFLRLRQEMNEKTNSNDLGNAFLLCIQIRDLYRDLATLKCMAPIAHKLKEDVDDLRAKVDQGLESMSRTAFNADTYASILTAMKLMHGGKSSKILEAHTTCFKKAIDWASKKAIIVSLLSNADDMLRPDELEKLKLETLCRRLREPHFPYCLNLMFEQFCNYLFTYNSMVQWLQKNIPEKEVDEKAHRIYRELLEGLNTHKRAIWEQEMQENITMMTSTLRMTEISVHTFLGILESMNKFITIAEEFSKVTAHSLRDRFESHAQQYFVFFHRVRLEGLRELLQKDPWTPIHVSKGYGLKDFKELQEIINITMPQQRRYKRKQQSFFDGGSVQANPFASAGEGGGMDSMTDEFEGSYHHRQNVPKYSWEESSSNQELLVEIVDEDGGDEINFSSVRGNRGQQNNRNRGAQGSKNNNEGGLKSTASSSLSNPFATGAPILSQSMQKLIDYIGEYMHLMQVLGPSAPIIFRGLVQLVEFYIWTIHSYFAVCDPVISNGDRLLAVTIKKISHELILDNETFDSFVKASVEAAEFNSSSSILSGLRDTFVGPTPTSPIPVPVLAGFTISPGGCYYKVDPPVQPTSIRVVKPKVPSPSNDLQTAITSALVAAGSLRFLRNVLASIQPNLIELLGQDRQTSVVAFCGTLGETTVPLRNSIFKYVVTIPIAPASFIPLIKGAPWDTVNEDVRESEFVRPLTKAFSSYIEKLKSMAKQQSLPTEALPDMTIQALTYVMELCIEGFSKARRVTTEGHNVMLYDMQQIKSELEKATAMRNHDWTLLDEYVHAYHFPQDDLIVFFKEHPSYTKSQLTGLVGSGPWDIKQKTRLFDALNYHGSVSNSSTDSSKSSASSSSSGRSRSTSSSRW